MRRAGCNNAYIFVGNTKWMVRDYFAKNKLMSIIICFAMVMSILTGIFTAAKNVDTYSLVNFDDYSISRFLSGDLGTWELFFSRMVSYGTSILVIFVMSFSIFFSPISICVIIFRGYLLGINCTFLVALFGLGGIISSLLIVFPCQLAILFLLSIYTVLTISRASFKRKFGYKCQNGKSNNFALCLLFVLAITLINLIETLLLSVFSSKLILVI